MFTKNLLEIVNSIVNQQKILQESEILLKEYTEATVQKLIDKFSGESPQTPKQTIRSFIELFDRKKNSSYIKSHEFGQDIFQWDFKTIEEVLSHHNDTTEFYPGNEPVPEVVYEHDGLTIKKAHTEARCVEYGDGYSWCISRKTDNLFNQYRYDDTQRVFYFVYDQKRSKNDPLHHVVIHVHGDGTMEITDANNRGDNEITWEELVEKMPRVKPAEKVFISHPTTKDEEALNQNVSWREFDKFSLGMKKKYLAMHKHFLLPDNMILAMKNTPSFKEIFNYYVRTRFYIPKKIYDICSPSQRAAIDENLKKLLSHNQTHSNVPVKQMDHGQYIAIWKWENLMDVLSDVCDTTSDIFDILFGDHYIDYNLHEDDFIDFLQDHGYDEDDYEDNEDEWEELKDAAESTIQYFMEQIYKDAMYRAALTAIESIETDGDYMERYLPAGADDVDISDFEFVLNIEKIGDEFFLLMEKQDFINSIVKYQMFENGLDSFLNIILQIENEDINYDVDAYFTDRGREQEVKQVFMDELEERGITPK